jgi:DNA (cytosine-5)-methyltransferase 1
MRYGSVCSGIEAATVAWHPLGWKPAFFSEIEPAPRSVLAHHYPDVPCHGDFTTIGAEDYGSIDLLVGGTPCQSFSIAGLRGGLDDDRGNLALEFLRLAQRTRPRWLVWENVPGVLSSNGGRDFGSILGAMVECGYGFAYRVLDAQYFGVAQRRRRVFVVGCLGDAASAAAVLFERESLSGHSAPRREKREEIAGTIARSSFSGGAGGKPDGAAGSHFVTGSLCARTGQSISVQDANQGHLIAWPAEIAPTLNAHFGDKMGLENQHIAGGGGLFVPSEISEDSTKLDKNHPICFEANMSLQEPTTNGLHPTLTRRTHAAVSMKSAVRRLTPRECERLQGFPDDYTLVPHRNKPMADGPRYKALGNSMAVPVMRWIGERIQMVEDINNA